MNESLFWVRVRNVKSEQTSSVAFSDASMYSTLDAFMYSSANGVPSNITHASK